MTREAFISHVERTEKAFRRFLTALCCGDAALADDIAQEAYIKAYLACGDMTRSEKIGAWLYKIGYTTFLNHKRSERITVGYEEAGQPVSCETADAAFRYQLLYMALDRLPPKERSAILLFYFENYSAKEIAEIVGASPDAVRQYLTRGRNHLRKMLIGAR